VFAVSSLVTPFFLGAVLGGLASGRVKVGTTASADAWANGTSVLVGLLTIAATAFLGAVFSAPTPAVRRRRSRRTTSGCGPGAAFGVVVVLAVALPSPTTTPATSGTASPAESGWR
jgi:cytochrome d ubiquinol oxidase subunit II